MVVAGSEDVDSKSGKGREGFSVAYLGSWQLACKGELHWRRQMLRALAWRWHKWLASAYAEEPADLKTLGNIDVVALMGQFTRDEASGVDILVVGDVNQNAVQKYVTELEEKEGKELRYTVLGVDEFNYRLQIKDRFISNVLLSKKQVLFDKDGRLG